MFVVFTTTNLGAQSTSALKLEKEVYALNNNAEYEKSVEKITEFLNNKNIMPEDSYYANIYLSSTYKRVFDYDNVLVYLDKAFTKASQIQTNKQYYIDNVLCEKAFALFDIQHYKESEILMQQLERTKFKNITVHNQSFIIMQQGYLSYLDKQYALAEKQYDAAIKKMMLDNPCDLPIIYAKKIALYGSMGLKDKMHNCYYTAMHYADSCKIIKYNLYATEIIRNTYKDVLKDHKSAYRYFDLYDSLNTIYNADYNKNKLNELQLKYETAKKEQALILNEKTIIINQRLIALLIAGIVMLILTMGLIITIQRRKKLLREKQNAQLFTKQLLQKTEEERKRIASDLHDSVNNELLLIKSAVDKNTIDIKPKIDLLMDHIRVISRNLHPVLFEDLGLQDSIEQLAERIQTHRQFILNTEIQYTKNSLTINDELQLYRIIQEAVNNIIKYSNALAGFISIIETNGKLIIEIKDNGKGFDFENTLKSKESFGLHNIIERSRAINGVPKITSDKHGTIIHIEIHINRHCIS